MIERPVAASERVTLAAHRAQQATRPPTIRRVIQWMEVHQLIGGKHPFLYPLVSSNMAGWKIPDLNGGFIRKITDFCWSLPQPAMFDYRRGFQPSFWCRNSSTGTI